MGRAMIWALAGLAVTTASFAPALDRGDQAIAADAATACSALAQPGRFPKTRVLEAALKSAGESQAFCEVVGEVSPVAGSKIGVVFRMPERWNGKVIGIGGGGKAGNVRLEGDSGAITYLTRGYATLQTDAGHPSADSLDNTWASLPNGEANVQALEDFAYRAVHWTAVVGKQVATAHYGRAPEHAYFQGCSTGGRQALASVQRYPEDYEGVIAGAPAFANRPLASMTMAGRAFADPASKPSKAQISLINDSVLAACDANDGLKDGLVTEPLKCAWDPKVLACKPGRSGDACLTPAQVAGVRAVYQDHHAADGTLVTFGLPKGSELSSYGFFVTPTRDIQYVWGMHHQAAGLERDADLDLSKNDPVANYAGERNALSNVLIYSENPDISPFMRRGGKLLMWTGTYDQLIPARSTYDYFEAMRRVTDVQLKAGASKIEVTDRTRLFTAVGVSHCGGGAGPGRFDALSALEAWVEKGEAPSQLVASDPEGATPRRSRPMCQHPTLPRYKGGDPNSAASFTCG